MLELIKKIFIPYPIDRYPDAGITKYSKEISGIEMNDLLNEQQMCQFEVLDEMKKLFIFEDYYLYYFYRDHKKVLILGKDPDLNTHLNPYQE